MSLYIILYFQTALQIRISFFFLCWSHNLEFIISGDKVSRESMGFFFSLLEKGAEDGDVGYVDGWSVEVPDHTKI